MTVAPGRGGKCVWGDGKIQATACPSLQKRLKMLGRETVACLSGPGYWLCCTVQPVGMPLLPEGQVTSFFLMKVPPEGTPLTQFISASLAEMSLAVQVIFLREVQLLNIME